MKSHLTEEKYQIIIVDSRPMFRSGIKSAMQPMMPGCTFSEFDLLPDLSMESAVECYTYFFLRAGDMSNKVIISAIKKIRSVYLNCKLILFDYQHQIGNIIHFFREKIDAYLPDDFGDHELNDCIKSLASNRLYVNMQITIDLLITTPRVSQRKKNTLMPAEMKVASLLVSGLSQSPVAKRLDRKIPTISTIK
ncbi:hypothetical protein GCM10010967_48580 [Dyadobacter beijingensis]|uniref:DNA-binding response regulator, NarL/FixJ family, contains REC and HTH domains n=1 Tax=Dyadobacter beijingensis TaxID=365489 RepID=A0ABQ2II32_9BACT|nr:response regulator transcription factor [Dyadobacter beijingensis]GGN07326.1 hypothetical protein GCM10010967_48580 [Dyadobacter beijingensis]